MLDQSIRFVFDKMALRKIFLQVLWLSPAYSALHVHLHVTFARRASGWSLETYQKILFRKMYFNFLVFKGLMILFQLCSVYIAPNEVINFTGSGRNRSRYNRGTIPAFASGDWVGQRDTSVGTATDTVWSSSISLPTNQVQDVRTKEGRRVSHHVDGRHSLTSDLGRDQFCGVLCSWTVGNIHSKTSNHSQNCRHHRRCEEKRKYDRRCTATLWHLYLLLGVLYEAKKNALCGNNAHPFVT